MNWVTFLVIVILIVLVIIVITNPHKKNDRFDTHNLVSSSHRFSRNPRGELPIPKRFPAKSSNLVTPSDIKDEQYLTDFFSQLQKRLSKVSSNKKNPVKSSHHKKSNQCPPIVKPEDVNFTEVPVVGAYGVNLLVQRHSSGTGGKDILFLHGLPFSFLSMRNVFTDPSLLSHHNVNTIQLRGLGAGPYPDPFGPQGGYDLTVTWADDINATITALGFTPGNVVLVCQSFGAMVAANYIRKYGQGMLAGLFFSNPYNEPLSTPYGPTQYDPGYITLAIDVLTNGWVPNGQGWKTYMSDAFIFSDQNRHHECDMYPNQGIEWGIHPSVLRRDFTLQLILAHEPTPNLSTNGPPNPNLSDRFTTGVFPFITVPTHILSGVEDKLLRASTAVDLHNAIPGSKLTEIECAGHDVFIDNPQAYNRTLRNFLHSL